MSWGSFLLIQTFTGTQQWTKSWLKIMVTSESAVLALWVQHCENSSTECLHIRHIYKSTQGWTLLSLVVKGRSDCDCDCTVVFVLWEFLQIWYKHSLWLLQGWTIVACGNNTSTLPYLRIQKYYSSWRHVLAWADLFFYGGRQPLSTQLLHLTSIEGSERSSLGDRWIRAMLH